MAIKKISDFEEVFALNDSDMILIERNGEGKSIKAINLRSYFGGGGAEIPTSFSITITGDNTATASEYATGAMVAYETIDGVYNWLAGRDLKTCKIIYNGHEYVWWDGNGTPPDYLFQFVNEAGYVDIRGLGEHESLFDFCLLAGSENVSPSADQFPVALKGTDLIGAMYGGSSLAMTESSFPVTFEVRTADYEEPDVPVTDDYLNENEAQITFDSSDQWVETTSCVTTNIEGIYDWLSNNVASINSVEFNGITYTNIYSNNSQGEVAYPACTIDTSDDSYIQIIFAESKEADTTGYSGFIVVIGNNSSDGNLDDVMCQIGAYVPSLSLDDLPITLKINKAESGNNFVINFDSDADIRDDGAGGITYAYGIKNITGLHDWLLDKEASNLIVKVNGEILECANEGQPSSNNMFYLDNLSFPETNITLTISFSNGTRRHVLMIIGNMSPFSKDDVVLSTIDNTDLTSSDLPITIELSYSNH